MSVRNSRSGELIAKTLLTLSPSFQKTLRHINRHGIPSDCALWISPCHAIYTVGMKHPVDIAFLDKTGIVVKLLCCFPPNCYTESTPDTISALELPTNRISESGIKVGDKLELEPV
jgi:hypothetical protein